jgi:hypothetical protein
MIHLKLRDVRRTSRGRHLLMIEMAETDRHADAATQKQIAFLCGRGMWFDGITKDCASWLIAMIRHGVEFRTKS